MGLNFRRKVGTKHVKLNIGKSGVTSGSLKIAKGITYNTKRGLTLGVPGTGISYNFGKKKKRVDSKPVDLTLTMEKIERDKKNFKAIGGYNKNAVISVIISAIVCITPLWPLGLIALIISLLWFIIDTMIKIFKANKIK